jgi:hypothetical protein
MVLAILKNATPASAPSTLSRRYRDNSQVLGGDTRDTTGAHKFQIQRHQCPAGTAEVSIFADPSLILSTQRSSSQ